MTMSLVMMLMKMGLLSKTAYKRIYFQDITHLKNACKLLTCIPLEL